MDSSCHQGQSLLIEVSCLSFISQDDILAYQLPHLGTSPCGRLKTLDLHGISLDLSFSEQLHSWFPNIKDLTIEDCCLGFSTIQLDKQKNLEVDCSDGSQPADAFVIRAPALAYLDLIVRPDIYKNGALIYAGNSLVKAYIFVSDGALSPKSEAMILGRLSSVSSLQLECFQTMAMLDEEFDAIPRYDNLRTLRLRSCLLKCHALKALKRFLQKSPNLEKLDLCFLFLGHFLQSSPNLDKLTLSNCKLLDGSMEGGGKSKSKKTISCFTNLEHVQCPKLKAIEIEGFTNDETSFLLGIEGLARKNAITITRL